MFHKKAGTKETVQHTMSSLPSRYERLYYPGPLSDGTPLPIAKSALYVDPMPSNAPKLYPNGKHGNEPAEKFILNNVLKMVKNFFLLQKEPLVDWSTDSKNRPIAEVLFTWNDMPGLTLNGQSTKLTYLFNTYDYDLAPENMSHFMLGVDIFWAIDGKSICPHIDPTKIVIAAGMSDLRFHQYFDSLEQAKNSKFYHVGNMYTFKSSWKTENFDFRGGLETFDLGLPKLLSLMLKQRTLCFEDWQNYARFWLSNYNNQDQDSAIKTGVAQEIASTDIDQNKNKIPCPNRLPNPYTRAYTTLEEVSQREKELILINSAEENDLNSLKKLESMGTNIEAKRGI